MAVPRNRHSNSRKNNKRSHHAKTKKQFHACPNCGVSKVPHAVCSSCGQYAKRQVLSVEA